MTTAAALLTKVCPECAASYEDAALFCPKDGAKLEARETEQADPYIGAVISGDIEIQGIAGSGSMGRVYRALQRGIERRVAVKILHRELSGNAQLVQRFHREAKIASKLQHQNVVEVHLAGQLPDGSMYIVMEYLDGRSIGAALREAKDRFPLERALAIVLQICDAVGEGHALHIVHRDLKPENVMLVRRGENEDFVKVLDFGIARVQLGDQSMETAAGRIFGTARYISPEGAAGNRVGPPGDVYAIATLLYQMLAGRTPFEGAPIGLLIKHIHEPPPHLHAHAPDVPAPIAELVMKNLAKEPELRERDARAFGAALAAAAREANVSVPEPSRTSVLRAVAFDPIVHDSAPPPQDEPTPEEPRSRRPTAWIALVILAFALGVGATLLAVRGGGAREAHVERVKRALNEGHYLAPPGENVNELVLHGLERWPNDVDLVELRSQAEHEMITMAMAAHASGDVIGARDLAEGAYKLDPTDNSARFMRAQCADDLAAIASGAALYVGAPRLVFESPPVVSTGARVEMNAKVVPGQVGASAKIRLLKVTVMPNGQSVGGAPVTITSSDPGSIRAELVAPSVGSWDVTMEVAVNDVVIRAMRDLDVTP